ncbi:MAG: hypothetical protein ACJAW9_003614 [Sulfitobacter sp.]|jgi:hypothetical protein
MSMATKTGASCVIKISIKSGLLCAVVCCKNRCRDLRPGYDHLLRYLEAAQAVIDSKPASFRRCYGSELISWYMICGHIIGVPSWPSVGRGNRRTTRSSEHLTGSSARMLERSLVFEPCGCVRTIWNLAPLIAASSDCRPVVDTITKNGHTARSEISHRSCS